MKTNVKKKSQSYLRKKADAVFSKYIRQRDKGNCYTCGRKQEWKSSQCGHFIPRQYLSTRYSEINCNAQCYACNMLYNGQPSAYAIRLTNQYGQEIIKELESKRKEINHGFDYKKVIDTYAEKCKELGYEYK